MGRLIGLTGQTGAGKTSVAALFEARGYAVIDGDVIAREIVTPPSPVLITLAERFGKDVINTDGTLNRQLLASRAFADKQSTDDLNSITHPEIIRLALERADEAYKRGCEYAVFDAAALFESGIQRLCYMCISVVAPKDERLRRITARDNISEDAALLRINAQKDEQYYINNADIVIRNAAPYSLEAEFMNAVNIIESQGEQYGKEK